MIRSPHRPIGPTCHSDTLAVAMVSGAANQPNRRRANRGDSNNGHQSETNSRGHYVRRPAEPHVSDVGWTRIVRTYSLCRFSNSMSNSQMECPMHVQLDISVRMVEW